MVPHSFVTVAGKSLTTTLMNSKEILRIHRKTSKYFFKNAPWSLELWWGGRLGGGDIFVDKEVREELWNVNQSKGGLGGE